MFLFISGEYYYFTYFCSVKEKHSYYFADRDPVLIEKSNLVNILKLVIKEVIESSLKFGRQLDSDHIPLHHFFIVLEHVLRHGLKPKKVTRSRIVLDGRGFFS